MTRRFAPGAAALAAALSLAAATCDDPQSPADSGDTVLRGAFDAGTLELRVLDPRGVTSLRLVATDLAYDAGTATLAAQVALRNAGATPILGPGAVFVSGFDPPSVEPIGATCTEPCPSCPLECAFDHSASYGDDGMLDPGETSEPRPWLFRVPEGGSFAFRARIAGPPDPAASHVGGLVFLDLDGDGTRGDGEPPLPGRPVELAFGGATRTAFSDAHGRFQFPVREPGLYELALVPTGFCVETTPPRVQVLVVRLPDGSLSSYDGAAFGCRGDAPPDSSVAVRGVVFVDLDRNGVRDRGEAGLAGVLVVGSVPSCPTFAPIEARTDAQGHYAMRLPPCAPPYFVHREPLAGHDDTTPNPVVAEMPVRVVQADFGVAPSGGSNEAFIDGVVFADHDGDGEWDQGESGIADVAVTASGLRCLTPVLVQVRTDAQGRYRIRGAEIGCPLPWVVHQSPPHPGCGTSPNPVILHGVPGAPPGRFRADFGYRPCPTRTP